MRKNIVALLVWIICLSLLHAFAYADTQFHVECYNGTVLFFDATIEYDSEDDPTYLSVGTPFGPDGKCFKGWYTQEEGGTKFDFVTTPITENLELYARWGEHTSTDTRTVSNSCTNPEEITLTCSVCGNPFKKTLPPRNHLIVHADEEASTCTVHGTAAHYYCTNEGCGALFEDEEGTVPIDAEDLELPLAEHQMELVPGRESSCIVAGNTAYYKCKVCNNLFDDEEGTTPTTENAHVRDLAAHDLTMIEANEATCTEKGNIAYYKCSVCEKLFSAEDITEEIDEASIEIDCQPHDLIHHNAVAATCTASGNREYWDCANCKKYFTSSEATAESETSLAALIIPNGHDLQSVSGTAATCTTDGTKAYWKCRTCNRLYADAAGTAEISAPEKIPASHKLAAVEAKAATCTRDGNKAYWKCTVCDKLFSDAAAGTEIKAGETIVPAAHQYKNGVCTICGLILEEYRIQIIKGNAGTAYYGNEYSFMINADYKTVRDTLEVKIDGKKIARSSFGLSGETTVITLSSSYIKTLSAGLYDIEIVTNQGTAKGYFRVSTSPKTGDRSKVDLWIAEEILSFLGMTTITWYLFHRKETY